MTAPIRVVLVDDQQLVRAGLRPLAERDGDIELVGETADGRTGLSRVRELRPDLVLMDLRMPVMDGLEATRAIVADPLLDGVRVLVLTTFDEDEHVHAAILAGAAGYLLKDIAPDDLRSAIRTVAAGDALLSPAITAAVMRPETNLVAHAVDVAANRGMRVAFNPSPLDDEALAVDLGAVDYLFVNEHEAAALTGAPESEEAVDRLARRWPRMQIMMTLGADGSIWRQGDQTCAVDAVRSEVVDTTGAGDTFTGFYLGSVLRGLPVERALETASRAASLAIGRKGAAEAIPTGALVGL